ncbi:tRNA (adenosine(37)-N6)-dimethylallyltransferase MiaA [Mediterraneibacter catenae]|uniref:tRNA dimethylallyltransferase n=1 Tax=Mediterraneibacter catenae TaxID=2594882 RepID=A0A5M9I2B1_9FIRM|nr:MULTISPECIES: tRNA (adenosine(37)-N6)-dimethylallyltransferase MiaA [Mediterraneibacter]KAA8501651.1 tRNA (adenosine(37)-N6)-dimethylallyltransferase MiaA [Mediterraneibacter catenae]MDN0043881.1 tRNA (adenosine(37)-N6)-dimethylallyltransferase MiaA [Mediterraneibacter glycyrrhizinilyticus]OUO30689.1 tRNA (adenosine(37)-N6)-dimethylallyltransferase MiaA [Lachnoclostridium sp. An298]
MTKKPLIILAGPTAVGKTALSIRLAKETGAEIISADSMQVYRGMDIGSAKITKEEMAGVPHYLVDVLEPEEDFNVVRFQNMAKDAAAEIWSKGKIPLVVGGTGFYIQALLYDIDFTENDGDESYRRELEKKASDEQGALELYEMLRNTDPKSAQEIHPRNIKRIIRALEFYRQTGKKISEHNETQRQKESPYNYAYFVLNDERSRLYERIDRRVDLMMEQGLLEEVRALRERGVRKDSTAMQGLGYKELYAYLDGEYPLDEAVRIIKRDTRHFAKRQITWFKREKNVVWADRSVIGQDDEKLADYMLDCLRDRKII